MASPPNTSATRRVLGDININININTPTFNIDHAPSVTKIPKASDGDKWSWNPPVLSKVVGNSTSEIRRENHQETDTNLQVGDFEEGQMDEKISSGRLEKGSGAARTSFSAGLSTAEAVPLAGQKRYLFAGGDVFEGERIQIGQGFDTKAKILSANSPQEGSGLGSATLSPRRNLLPCNAAVQDKGAWAEGFSRFQVYDPLYDCGSNASLESPRPGTQIKPSVSPVSPVSPVFGNSSSSSVGNTEDTANNSQAAKKTTSDDLPFIPTTVSTTRSFRASKSKSLSRAEIRQKCQALRLRLSLANYKVQTNQIDLPLSRLEARSASPKLPCPARQRGNPSYGASMGSRTPLPGAPDRNALIPAIHLQRPSPPRKNVRVFIEDREKDRNKDLCIPSIPSPSRSDSLSRRDSAIPCTSPAYNSSSGVGHAHPLTPTKRETNRHVEINVEREVARRKQDVLRGWERENTLQQQPRKPILERQKLEILRPPIIFAQPDLGVGMERSPELSKKAADGLLRLSLLR
ncbi:hypothetical protein DSL72_000105 [Monilinia vaccinii-corymbosi]|uniref:Uncharacterized protein n=1 Tax=Monilinia vaccinii-corymbosi TaxID=61207 RepID=A0A8A3P5U2_9HELO|nr:hypothetical protein DSL72_000105 [Monilinia vaccinii-corymbosi]